MLIAAPVLSSIRVEAFPGPVTLRRATVGDAEDLLAWRNDPVTRTNSLDREEMSRARYFAWIGLALSDPERLLLVAEHDGGKLGMARFDCCGEAEWRVAVTVAPAARGRGIGRAVLAAAIRALERERGPGILYAEIRVENRSSRQMFEACGFTPADSDDGVCYYRRTADSKMGAEAIY